MLDIRKSKAFKLLDPIVQDQVMRAGIQFQDEEELMQYAREQKQ